jgi:hypothetical protein
LQNPRTEFELATKPVPAKKVAPAKPAPSPDEKPAPVKKAAAKKQTPAPRRPE